MFYYYTVITNNFDNLRPVEVQINANERHICFSDRPRWSKGWTIQPIPPAIVNQRRASRIPKCLPHLLMPDATVSVYGDGAFKLQIPLADACNLLGDADIGLFTHPTNKSIHDEHQFYLDLHKYVPNDVEEEYQRYVAEGLPVTGQFYAGGLIIRKHNKIIEEFNELWMKMYMKGSNNDQFSLYYALTKVQPKIKILGPDNLWDKRFGYCLHAHEGGYRNEPFVQDNAEWKERIGKIMEICNA